MMMMMENGICVVLQVMGTFIQLLNPTPVALLFICEVWLKGVLTAELC